MRKALFVLAVLAVAFQAFAASTCEGDTYGVVVIDGFAEVRYGDLHADSRADRAEFGRGVCIIGLVDEWIISAETVVLENLSTNPRLVASNVAAGFVGWTITGSSLTGGFDDMRFVNAQFVGPNEEYSGSAATIAADFESGRLAFTDVHIADRVFAIVSAEAVLLGDTLTLEHTTISTCIDSQCTFYNLTGTHAEVDLVNSVIMLENGVVNLAGIPIPLAPLTELSERAFEKFEFPVDIRIVASASGPVRNGSGLLLVLKNMRYVPGMKMQAGFSGLNKPDLFGVVAFAELEPHAVEEADGTSSTTRATAGVRANRPFVSVTTTRPVGTHSTLSAQFVTGADYGKDYRHEALISLASKPSVSWLPGVLSTEAFIGMLGLSPHTRDPAATVTGLPLADARFGVSASHQISQSVGDHVSLGLQTTLQDTYYPGHRANQWGVRLQPSAKFSFGPAELSLSYLAVFTNEASPFSTGIDRLTKTQRASVSLNVRDVIPGAASSRVYSDFVYQFPLAGARSPGLRSWNSGVRTSFAVTADWQLDLALSAELAKLLDTRAASHAALTFSALAERSGYALIGSDPGGTLEFGTRWRYAITPNPSLTRAEFSVGVPFVFDLVELKPYVALDFVGAITQTGRPVKLSGHGLDVTFITHGGSIMVGYRAQDSNWDMRVGVDIYRRPASTKGPAESGMIAD